MVGGGAPVVVQSMSMTDTADPASTAQQCIELWQAGSEMVRVTVNLPEAAAAVPEIKRRMLDAGCTAPLIGDFHYNGHLLLTRYPECAAALDKYRINPGNVGTGEAPNCPVFIDGVHATTLKGTYDEVAHAFHVLLDDYVENKYPKKLAVGSLPVGS